MKTIFPLILFIIFISCKDGSDSKANVNLNKLDTVSMNKDLWIDDFKKFRDAVYHKRKEEVKTYFNFPIRDNPDIWNFAFENGPFAVEYETAQEEFSEGDFDKAYDNIFSKPFINSILKIKSDSLLLNNHFETVEFNEKDSLFYNMAATVDQEQQKLNLSLNIKTTFKIDKNEYENTESSYIFIFKILNNHKIKFLQIIIAG